MACVNSANDSPAKHGEVDQQVVTQLLAGIAHELNNQLGVVTGNAELLMRKLDGDDLQFVREIVRAGAETREVLKNIAELASQPSARAARIRIGDLVQTGIDWLSVQYQIRAEIEVLQDRDRRYVQVEVMRGARSIADILRYAHASSSDSSAGPLQLRISTASSEDAAHIYVDIIDHNGVLGTEEQSIFFEPYIAVDTRPKPGLSLYVARHRLRSMGGDAFVAESGEERTIFRVALPLAD